MKKGKKYAHLLAHADVKRWYENRKRGSPITADVSLRRLGAFCEQNSLTPKQLVSMKDRKIFELMLDYVSSEEKKGYAGSYIVNTIKAVKSWLAYNNKEIKGKIKIRGIDDTPSLRNEKVPSQEELKRILLSGDKKSRTISVLMAHSGLRPETVGDYFGKDGLCIGDLPEIEIRAKEVNFTKVPALTVVRSELSKAKHRYFTFLSDEGCGYLKDYLEERILDGEKLSADSPVITPKLRMKPFVRTVNIGDAVRGAIRKAGFPWRPYVLRSFFDTQLMVAESKGHIIRDYRAFFMGHKGDIENRYTTNRRRLPEEVIEDMRASYRKSQAFLQTASTVDKQDLMKEFDKRLLLVAGFKSEEINDINPDNMTDEEFQNLLRKKLFDTKLNGNRQKVVPVDQMDGYIEQGWEFVTELSNHKAVLKLA